ncbi:FtsX-like permease family protein [Shimazuella kribbensis]|uniref:FtsX-like permease family protein n=1 Tax=Shimazuella kribbensis TaxID=139808 RepID=UPI0004079A49|nr:FtsX-like permease family protein [Shimazuella kribbensis]
MTLKAFAIKNIQHHRNSYQAYFLSCIFAVWVFFLYASLLFHPILDNKLIPEQFVFLLYMVEGIVAIFAFLFIGYSQSAFLRNRKQDIGLLQVLGMPVGQVVRMLFWENLFVGFLALLVGVIAGLISEKFFLLAISYILHIPNPIPFDFSFVAIMFTTFFFLCLFLILSWWSRYSIQKQSINAVLREKVQEKKRPTFSIWLVVVSLVCILMAYMLSFTISFAGMMKYFLIILVMILIGTYLGYTQLSVVVISLIEKMPKWFYRKINMFLFSQLRFRLKDNANILFLVTIFTSIVLTSVGVSITYYMEADKVAQEQAPYHVSMINSPINPSQMQQKIAANGLRLQRYIHFSIIQMETTDRAKNKNNPTVYVMDNSALNVLLKQANQETVLIGSGEVVQVKNSGAWAKDKKQNKSDLFSVQHHNQLSYQWKWSDSVQGILFNEHDQTRLMWAVADDTFQKLKKGNEVLSVEAYQFTNYQKTKGLLSDLKKMYHLQQKDEMQVNGTFIVQTFFQNLFSPLLFVSVFIGLLFFLAAGSILFFRLYIELPVERHQLSLLSKLGLHEKEGQMILVRQIQILFLLPFVVGSIHSIVALHLFSFLLDRPVYVSFLWIWLIYFVLGTVYYGWTKRQMIRAL